MTKHFLFSKGQETGLIASTEEILGTMFLRNTHDGISSGPETPRSQDTLQEKPSQTMFREDSATNLADVTQIY